MSAIDRRGSLAEMQLAVHNRYITAGEYEEWLQERGYEPSGIPNLYLGGEEAGPSDSFPGVQQRIDYMAENALFSVPTYMKGHALPPLWRCILAGAALVGLFAAIFLWG